MGLQGDRCRAMVGRPLIQQDVLLSRADAWHRRPAERLAELRQDVARAQARGDQEQLLQLQRYVVTFRRHHRI